MRTAKDFGCRKIIEVNNIIPSAEITIIELIFFEDFKKSVKKNSYVLKWGNAYYLFDGPSLYQWINKNEKIEISTY